VDITPPLFKEKDENDENLSKLGMFLPYRAPLPPSSPPPPIMPSSNTSTSERQRSKSMMPPEYESTMKELYARYGAPGGPISSTSTGSSFDFAAFSSSIDKQKQEQNNSRQSFSSKSSKSITQRLADFGVSSIFQNNDDLESLVSKERLSLIEEIAKATTEREKEASKARGVEIKRSILHLASPPKKEEVVEPRDATRSPLGILSPNNGISDHERQGFDALKQLKARLQTAVGGGIKSLQPLNTFNPQLYYSVPSINSPRKSLDELKAMTSKTKGRRGVPRNGSYDDPVEPSASSKMQSAVLLRSGKYPEPVPKQTNANNLSIDPQTASSMLASASLLKSIEPPTTPPPAIECYGAPRSFWERSGGGDEEGDGFSRFANKVSNSR
jgi:hypothetical protein